jgi:ribonuclease P/MRP protein subunit POP5
LLPPTLRERRRYLAFELISEREIDKRELLKEIRDSIYSLYGDTGASESKMWLIEYSKNEDADGGTDRCRGVGILRCAHNKVEEVRAALACIHSASGVRLGIRVIGISGTIKGATRLTIGIPKIIIAICYWNDYIFLNIAFTLALSTSPYKSLSLFSL